MKKPFKRNIAEWVQITFKNMLKEFMEINHYNNVYLYFIIPEYNIEDENYISANLIGWILNEYGWLNDKSDMGSEVDVVRHFNQVYINGTWFTFAFKTPYDAYLAIKQHKITTKDSGLFGKHISYYELITENLSINKIDNYDIQEFTRIHKDD